MMMKRMAFDLDLRDSGLVETLRSSGAIVGRKWDARNIV